MAVLTVRSVPDAVHRALRLRATAHGRSTEAEIRAILAESVMPDGHMKLGSLLADIGCQINLTDAEIAVLEQVRDKAPSRPAAFD